MQKTNRTAGWGCALVTLCCILLIHPSAEIGINDDWSYAYSAKHLAETGNILYNGWATAILGVQLYLGALCIRLFGFSFLTVRASSMLISVLTVPVLHALLMRCGIRAWNATLGTLTLAVSPLYLPLATTYMSDSFALCLLILFFYACVRWVSAEQDRNAIFWMIAASASGVAAGSVRQIAWLSVLVSIPCLVWQQRRRRGMMLPEILVSSVAIGVAVWLNRWFQRQPYVSIENLYHLPHLHGELMHVWLPTVGRCLTECVLLLLPSLAAIAWKFPLRERGMRLQLFVLAASAAILVATVSLHYGGLWWARTLLVGNTLTEAGVYWDILGRRASVLPPGLEIATAFIALTTAMVAVRTVLHTSKQRFFITGLDRSLIWMTGPFTAAYLLLVFTRFNIYDRYFLPLLVIFVLAALRWLQVNFADNTSWIGAIPVVALMTYGVITTHDRFAAARGELAAVTVLRTAGVPRVQIDGGFEYNGWTEIENRGYVNEPRLRPSSAYHPYAVPQALKNIHPAVDRRYNCYSFFYTYTPSIHARYALQRAHDSCFPDASNFAPTSFQTWLPPKQGFVYIAAVPPF